MAPERDPRIQRAFSTMKRLGLDVETVKPVLKRLLKLYNRNWELIEEDNFRTLADAIFESQDDKLKAEKNTNTIDEDEDGEPPFKKPHRGLPEDQASSTGGNGKTIVDLEEDEVPKTSTGVRIVDSCQLDSRVRISDSDRFVSEGPSRIIDKRKDPVQVKLEEDSSVQQALGTDREPGDASLGSMVRKMELDHDNGNGIVPMETQPVDHSSQFASPSSHIHPGSTSTSQHSDSRKKKIATSSAHDHQTMYQTSYDIASSTCGQVKLSLTFNHPLQQNNFKIPNADEVLSFVDRKVLNELCESYLQTGADSVNRLRINRSPGNHNHRSLRFNANSSRTDQSGLASAKQQLMPHTDKKRVFHKVNDITNGTEKVKISLLDEIGNEELPNYIYCPENITYESAYVHITLARIADEDCCSGCIGDCLSSSIPCACARDTGGEFAYTPEGLLNDKFLRSCISMNESPRKDHLFYCQDCPLERARKVDKPGKCKGHVLRKFIKECWRKCGCNMQCGNRVVQRGITRKLQVFLTSDGKGWGLRTLEELPKGAFICEYVGEILTNIELYERNKKSSGQDKHVYPVLLDADWATEGVLKDEDALCLDATHFGNVARFINHRCFDGNLLEIPVQVETPDRHYYHLAFFTTRKVEAFEELTWDYGIDFDDNNHPIKAFQCRCGSKYCRSRKGKK